MGLLKAGVGAIGGMLGDQWKEFFYCDSLPNDVLMRKAEKSIGGKSSNTKANDNIISNGSLIAIADGQCMIIVEQGKVVEICAEPGEFIYDTSSEPSIFTGNLGESIKETFKTIGKRFTFGGDTAKDQKVYYFNTKEIIGNKFGTQNPIMFEVVNKKIGISRSVQIRCNGMYTYVISNPLLFYTRLCGNVENEFLKEQIDEQLKSEFIDALQPALGKLSEQELRPAQLTTKVSDLKKAMNEALKQEWIENRGISVEKITLNPITLTEADMKKINELEDAANIGCNPYMMAGRMTNATADAMQTAAGNSAGAFTGFMGMGMTGMGGQGGFGAAQNMFNMGVQNEKNIQNNQTQVESTKQNFNNSQNNEWKCSCGAFASGNFCPECGNKKPDEVDGWTCSCKTINKGKFCQNCGNKKPDSEPQYACDKCGWEVKKGETPPKFCPECGDPFDDNDICK